MWRGSACEVQPDSQCPALLPIPAIPVAVAFAVPALVIAQLQPERPLNERYSASHPPLNPILTGAINPRGDRPLSPRSCLPGPRARPHRPGNAGRNLVAVGAAPPPNRLRISPTQMGRVRVRVRAYRGRATIRVRTARRSPCTGSHPPPPSYPGIQPPSSSEWRRPCAGAPADSCAMPPAD